MEVSQLIPPAIESLIGEEGWTPIDMSFSTTGGASFIEGDPEGQRLRIRMFVREADRRLFARVWFGPLAEGPPAHAHGGSMAAVLDHAMGMSAWVAGHPVLAASITINFHRKLPLGTIAVSECWVDRVEGRKVYTVGRLYHDDPEKPFGTGQGLFIAQDIEKFKGVLRRDETLEENMEKARANMRGR
jgi:acyl-coenzyme A thioesterase PaaI-like protein